MSVSGDDGIVNQIEHMGRSYAGVSLKGYRVVETDDVVYTKSPLRSNPYGIIKTNTGSVGIVSTLYAVYKGNGNINTKLIHIYFQSDSRLNNYLRPLINKGPKNTLLVSDEGALDGFVDLPPSINEQNKIVELFDTIELLTKNISDKLSALKKYKEGFVNNWFSTNKSNGCLGDVVHKVHTTLTISSCLDNTGDYPVYDANGDIIAYTNFYNNACDSIAIITRGSGCGRTFKTYGKHSVLGTMEELIVDNEKMYDYVYAFTKSSYFKRLCNERIERGAMPALYPEDYLSARLYISNQSTIEKFTRMFNLLEEIESLTNKEENLLSSIKKQLLKDMFV